MVLKVGIPKEQEYIFKSFVMRPIIALTSQLRRCHKNLLNKVWFQQFETLKKPIASSVQNLELNPIQTLERE